MTIFNPENKEVLTFGQIMDPAMTIRDYDDAQQYLESYVAWLEAAWARQGKVAEEPAINIAKSNIGYWAGYYGDDTRRRVERVFECEHPVFGSIIKKGSPTAKEAFELGMKIGEAAAKRKK